jgi:CheY-like chemotaxis protein
VLTVLVVDDEPIVRDAIVALLGVDGHRVRAESAGEAAVAALAAEPFDLLITDISMPGMDGRELVSRARSLRPGLKTVLLSGWASDAIVRGGRDECLPRLEGYEDVGHRPAAVDAETPSTDAPEPDLMLGKPVSLSTLRAVVAELFPGRSH